MADDKVMMIILMIFTIGFSFLSSVNGIRCHQCNSHLDENCLTLNLPKSNKLTEQFLRECDQNNTYDGKLPFCRKTTYTIEYSEEHRVVRSCGWLKDISIHAEGESSDNCLNADNEGFKETICNCHQDACNTANINMKLKNSHLGLVLMLIFIISLLRNF